jgi:hypothetical protein|tara:strand:- start:38 stop:382 length:345 start_codon:yes stop_codon:yes gene_type:complete
MGLDSSAFLFGMENFGLMVYDIMKWAKLAPSKSGRDPIPGDLVHVMPRAAMAGYVLCGATYVGGHQVPSSEDRSTPGEPATMIHEVLFHGKVVTVSSHSHNVQVIDYENPDDEA